MSLQGLELLQLLGEGGGSRRADATAEMRKQQVSRLTWKPLRILPV